MRSRHRHPEKSVFRSALLYATQSGPVPFSGRRDPTAVARLSAPHRVDVLLFLGIATWPIRATGETHLGLFSRQTTPERRRDEI